MTNSSSSLPRPHGSEVLLPRFVAEHPDRAKIVEASRDLPTLKISSAAAANAVMLGAGYFTPLLGYMNREQALSVASSMRLSSGLLWPVPVMNLVHAAPDVRVGGRVALLDPNCDGTPLIAVQEVESVDILSDEDITTIILGVFGTTDVSHPGVAAFLAQGRVNVSGPIQVLNYSYFEHEFPDTFLTAPQIRTALAQRGWRKAVAFQTRNPMHRAHEELCKIALQTLQADGLVIHMLLGRLKAGDVPAAVRDAAIRAMVENYFEDARVLVCGYGFDMLYAGPREAVLHAIFRQNAGCAYFIVGRDHAGVGEFYGPFEAQTIFDSLRDDDLSIQIFRADHTAWSRKLNRVVMMRDVPDHQEEDYVLLSGTKVREMLTRGEELPPEFARPEVARVLMEYYRHLQTS